MSFPSNALIVAAALTLPFAACSPEPPANREARAREATAGVIAGAAADQIAISQLQAGSAKWTWKAETGGKTYECDADELLRLPDCRPAG